MRLAVFGLNHQTAPLSIREKLTFDQPNTVLALNDLLKNTAVNEAVLLSTCHRTEIYTASTQVTDLLPWMINQPKIKGFDILPLCYHYQDSEMIRHVMRVASGLDSLVLGEPQILGQIKKAYALAQTVGTIGRAFKHLFPLVFAIGKQVRKETGLGTNPVSLAYAVVQLAKRLFASLHQCQVLLVGAGEIIELMATHLLGQGVRQLQIANRTLTRAKTLAKLFSGQALDMADIPLYLKAVDMVVTATLSPLPILGKGAIESALKHRKRRPLLLIDLAMPRNIEPQVSQLEDVYLYNLEGIQSIIEKNQQNRKHAAKQAEALVNIQASHYLRHLNMLKAGEMIQRFRERATAIRDQSLEKAIIHLHKTKNPEVSMSYLANQLTNKLLHHPTVKLRKAAHDERMDLLLLAKEWLDA